NGLFQRTTGLWASPDFLALTGDEVRDLLDLDDSFGFKGPATILQLLGTRLPTEQDCAYALRSADVRTALEGLCSQELFYFALNDKARTVPRLATMAERQRSALRERREALFVALDRAAPDVSWSVLHSAFERWSR